ncbi:hypothetical protein N0V82_000360 [Gnomoniopsis sp. IMI 355080]|nr:hypothetical protein N0V82_000360 [Gnomoniopsis sp. IMI 355080]
MASWPRGLGLLGSMYGAAPHDPKSMDGSDDEGDDDGYVYPTGLKRAALLACALVPYMVQVIKAEPEHKDEKEVLNI